MSKPLLVLGADGGGTKSHGLVADDQGVILGSYQVGGSNPNVVGFKAAADALSLLIIRCCESARVKAEELASVVLGLAGVGRAEDASRMVEEVNARLAHYGERPLSIAIETDARVALEGAFDGGAGIVIIAGTGSIVFGKTSRGEVLRVGGWGRTLGDEGSGYYIGREALTAVTHDMDNRGYAGSLKNTFAKKFKWNTRDDIIEAVYRDSFDIPSLAPLVMQAAENNDLVSQKILDRAASLLVEQVDTLVKQMAMTDKVQAVMLGGLMQSGSIYADAVQMKILRSLPQIEIITPKQSPAHGAVLMAIQRLH